MSVSCGPRKDATTERLVKEVLAGVDEAGKALSDRLKKFAAGT